ncbi:MAG: hypothetical protein V5A24_07650, partial [Haloarculaceae archaeon]
MVFGFSNGDTGIAICLRSTADIQTVLTSLSNADRTKTADTQKALTSLSNADRTKTADTQKA